MVDTIKVYVFKDPNTFYRYMRSKEIFKKQYKIVKI